MLSEKRMGFTATPAGNKIYFAGGWNSLGNTSATIDIYDDGTGSWSTSTLNIPKAFHSAIFKDGKIYWAGGGTYIDDPWIGGNIYTCQIEIKDINLQTTTFANLYSSKAWVGWNGAFQKDDKIIYLDRIGSSLESVYFDIYDIIANTWSIGVLNQSGIYNTNTIISNNSTIYVAGGYLNNEGNYLYTNQVWKLEF